MADKAVLAALADLSRINSQIIPVADARRWCEGLGYVKRVRADGPGTLGRSTSDVGDVLCACPDPPATDDDGRPRRCGPCTARDEVQTADRLIGEAHAALNGALTSLTRALAASDRGHSPRPAEFRVTVGRDVTKSELRKAEQARDRRRARGEGYG